MRTSTVTEDLRWSLKLRSRLVRGRRALRRARVRTRAEDEGAIAASIPARIALIAVTSLYVLWLSYLTLKNHYGFGTFGFDLGIFEQGMWLLSRFEEPFVTVRGVNLFADHTSFFLLTFVPLYWLFPSASVLLVAQSLALGGGAIAVFLLAREKLRVEWLAAGAALAYLAHPAVAWTNFENFHPDAFEVPLLLFAIYFMVVRSWFPFMACVIALLLVKEDVPLLTFMLGIYVALRYDRRIGLATAGLSLLWFGAALLMILPAFSGGGSLYTGRVTDQFGGVGGLLKTVATRPWEVAAIALQPEKRWYLWQLLSPLALLPILSPSMAIVAIAPLLSNLLTTFWYQYHIEYHYSTLIVPVLVAASVFGIAHFRSLKARTALVSLMTATSVIAAYLWGPIGRNPAPVADPWSPQAKAARQVLRMIPPDSGVSAFYAYVPHLTHRRHVYGFPNPWRAAYWGDWSQEGQELPHTRHVDYVVLPRWYWEQAEREAVDAVRGDGFELVREVQDVLLFERDPDG